MDSRRSATCALVALAALVCVSSGTPRLAQTPGTFAERIAALSEPEGYFDTDNLISNERSYLQVIPELQRRNVRGGAYVGVGPDQNFSYMAHVRPTMAFVVDVRRDNLLLHLLFKALFTLARTRVEYLALLLGRAVPADPNVWMHRPIDQIVSYMEAPPLGAPDVDALRRRIDAVVRRSGVPLSAADFATIDRFHRRFVEAGLTLQFQSTGRPPQRDYPTYRDLLLEVDSRGRRTNYLASEDAFQFLKALQERDLVVPVVGDLSGPRALAEIGRFLARTHESLSAIYVSNVEFYLFRTGRFGSFVGNLSRIPRTGRSVIVRSIFNRYVPGESRPDSASTSLVQPVDDLVGGFAAGRYRQYSELFERR